MKIDVIHPEEGDLIIIGIPTGNMPRFQAENYVRNQLINAKETIKDSGAKIFMYSCPSQFDVQYGTVTVHKNLKNSN